jgi:hypothetical protein
MTFEDVLPELKAQKAIKRPNTDGRICFVQCADKKMRLRIWRGFKLNYPYALSAEDLLASDWEVI